MEPSAILNPQEARKLLIEHACQCLDPNCGLPSCQKMKRVIHHHTKNCKRKTVCPVCKLLIVHQVECLVPFGPHIKYILKQLDKLNVDEDASSSSDMKESNLQKSMRQYIENYIQSLVHACQCRDPNFHYTSCQNMKRTLHHTEICKQKTNGGCHICKLLMTILFYHGKHCQEENCLLIVCPTIKKKLK